MTQCFCANLSIIIWTRKNYRGFFAIHDNQDCWLDAGKRRGIASESPSTTYNLDLALCKSHCTPAKDFHWNFLQKVLWVLWELLNFAVMTLPKDRWIKTSMDLGLQDAWLCIAYCLWLRKDVYERYLLLSDFATLVDTQKIRQLNVHVRCIISMPLLAFCIISLGVGCRVAYPVCRQCEGLRVG